MGSTVMQGARTGRSVTAPANSVHPQNTPKKDYLDFNDVCNYTYRHGVSFGLPDLRT